VTVFALLKADRFKKKKKSQKDKKKSQLSQKKPVKTRI
jgi:hypothetical protein